MAAVTILFPWEVQVWKAIQPAEIRKLVEEGTRRFGRGKIVPDKSALGADLLKAMPSWPILALHVLLALTLWLGSGHLLPLLKPYAYDVCKNLRGLPQSWADLALDWSELGLKCLALAAAVYQLLWQLGTRYRLTSHALVVEHWFPRRGTTMVPYGFISRASFSQNPLELLCFAGSLEIDSGGASAPLILESCHRPDAFFRLLQAKVDAAGTHRVGK
jgi:hypothetical protein